jgi:hypothetical protein
MGGGRRRRYVERGGSEIFSCIHGYAAWHDRERERRVGDGRRRRRRRSHSKASSSSRV